MWILFAFGEGSWGGACERLMRPEVVVVDEELAEFGGEFVKVGEGGCFDEVVFEGSPEALDLSVGLWAVGPRVAVLDAEFAEHEFERMLLGPISAGEFGAVVGDEFGELHTVALVQGV
jgi:hypothetical protein